MIKGLKLVTIKVAIIKVVHMTHVLNSKTSEVMLKFVYCYQ